MRSRPARRGDRRPAGRHHTTIGVALAVAAVALTAAACSKGGTEQPTSSAPRSTPTTAPSPRTASPTTAPGGSQAAGGAGGGAAPAAATCSGANLTGRLLDANFYDAGFGDWLLELRNTATTPCTMIGYPTVQLLDDRGQPVPTRLHRGAGPALGGRLPEEVDLASGAAAVFGLETYACTGTAPQTAAAQLQVTAPGDTTPIVIKLDKGITSCTGGDVLVSPVRQNPSAGIPT
jgi:hypothetical protein